jgi:hypothetical protein
MMTGGSQSMRTRNHPIRRIAAALPALVPVGAAAGPTQLRIRSQGRLGAMVASLLLVLGTTPAGGALQEWEVGGAQIQLSRVTMLAERISKQNLLYQLKLGEQTKDEVVATAKEMDQALRVLYEGSPLLGVRPPPSRALRDQIDRIDAAWGPVRAMALASPHDYLRRAGGARPGDPMRVLVFDERVQRVVDHAARAQELYFEICMEQKLPACEAMRLGPSTTMLSERLVKEAVLVYAQLDAKENLARLAKTRAALKRWIEQPEEVELVRQARSPARGVPGRVVGGMRRDVERYWSTLRSEVDRVLEGDVREFDIPLAMNAQERLVAEFQRYTIAIVRFAAERRARGTTRPPVAATEPKLADPSRSALLNYEYGAAQAQLGQVQVLAERISKRHVLEELGLADQRQVDVVASVEEMDEVLQSLRKGDPLGGIPEPPTKEIQQKLERLGEVWTPLRDMALASPFNYLRQSREFVPPSNRRGDPLHLRYFDWVASQVIEAARAVAQLYDAECRADGYTHCAFIQRQGAADMLTERLVKQVALVFAGVDPHTTKEDIIETRDAYNQIGEEPRAQRFVEQVTAGSRGQEGVFLGELLLEIAASWEGLGLRADRVIEGIAEDDDIREAARLQEVMVADLHRLTVAVTQFARVEQGGEGLPQ